MKIHFIYKITNILNNKVYIGQTKNPSLRWSQHKSAAKYNRGNQNITKAIIKYGVNSFSFEIIASCLNQEDINFIEAEIISQYDSRNPECGYNIAIGGNTSEHTEEVCYKISQGLKEFYKNNQSVNKGIIFSQEWREKLSKAATGKLGTNLGKKFNDDWKNNISTSLKGRKLSKSHRNKLSKIKTGHIAANRKLTFEIAENIRKEYILGNITQKQLGIKYEVSQDTIFNILKFKTYKGV